MGEKSSSFYRSIAKMCDWKTKILNKYREKGWTSKFTVGIFKMPKNAVATAFRKPQKAKKIVNLYLSIKQLITLEIVINSLSGSIFKMQQ